MKTLILRFIVAETAAASAKYGLIAAVLAAAIVTCGLGIVTKLTANAGEYGLP
jgi:Flp pilus assembly pilin Flp